MFQGHDTTSSAIAFCIYELAQNTRIQQRVYDEVSDLFEEDHKKILTLNELTELKYVEMVVKETLRKYPSVPFIARQLLEDVHYGKNLFRIIQ